MTDNLRCPTCKKILQARQDKVIPELMTVDYVGHIKKYHPEQIGKPRKTILGWDWYGD